MSIEVKIPAVGESITSGVLSTWHKQNGDTVAEGEALFTLETDKISTEVPAVGTGKFGSRSMLVKKLRLARSLLCWKTTSRRLAGARNRSAAVEAAALPVATGDECDVIAGSATGSPKKKKLTCLRSSALESAGKSPNRIWFSIWRRKALRKFRHNRASRHRQSRLGSSAAELSSRFTRRKMTPLRKKIAAQLVMAQQNAAMLTTFNECDMSAVMQFRSQYQESFQKRHPVKLGFMSFFIKAVVDALQSVPEMNARIDGDDLD